MRRNHQVREGMRPGSMGTRQSGNISKFIILIKSRLFTNLGLSYQDFYLFFLSFGKAFYSFIRKGINAKRRTQIESAKQTSSFLHFLHFLYHQI